MKFLSVEEMIVKTGQSCRECNAMKKVSTDQDSPIKYYPQEINTGFKGFTIGKSMCKHISGLCYYHLKKKQGLFTEPTILEKIKLETGRALRDG